MFPHPQNLITVLTMEHEREIAAAACRRRFARRSREPRASILRRAARAVAMLAG